MVAKKVVKVVPASNCVVVKPVPKETKVGEIVLAIRDDQGDMGIVVSVGSKINNGDLNIKEGDCIIFERHFAQNFSVLDGNVIVKSVNIIATVSLDE